MPAIFQPWRTMSVLALLGAMTVSAAPSDPTAGRGRAIFREGLHADGSPLAAVTGEQAVPLPAAFVACIHCHGHDARGKTDGGVTTSDIRWDTLAKPYELTLPGGRRRGPYDATHFFDALTKGVDSGGRPLDPAMPRYRLSATEASDVIAYLQEVGRPVDEGVTDTTVRIGFGLPADAALAATAEQDRSLLTAWLERVNRQGGVFRRRLELVTVGLPVSVGVLAVFAGDADDRTVAAYTTERITSLRTVASINGTGGRYEFALYPGVAERAGALVRHAVAHGASSGQTVALLYHPEHTSQALVDAVITGIQPLTNVQATPVGKATPDEIVRELRAAGTGNVLLLGGEQDFADLLASAQRLQWDPLFLWPDPPVKTTGNGRALGAQQARVSDLSAEARAEYAGCIAQSGIKPTERDRARQLALLASARLLVDALNNAGREVNREKLVESLEALGEIRSGFGPVGGFTPRRHTVVSEVQIAPLASSPYRPEPEWVTIH